MRLFDATGAWLCFLSGFRGQLLSGRLASGGLACGLLRAGLGEGGRELVGFWGWRGRMGCGTNRAIENLST